MADLDLQECLAKSIIAGTGLAVTIDYMAPDNSIGLVPETGSHVLEEDYDGTQEWQYNYAITIEINDAQLAKQNLFKISNYLNGLKELNSENGSFIFEDINVSSAPAMTLKDVEGNVQYLLDVAVLVLTNKYGGGTN